MPPRKLKADEHKRYLMRTAKTKAESRITIGGKFKVRAPVTLAPVPWKTAELKGKSNDSK